MEYGRPHGYVGSCRRQMYVRIKKNEAFLRLRITIKACDLRRGRNISGYI